MSLSLGPQFNFGLPFVFLFGFVFTNSSSLASLPKSNFHSVLRSSISKIYSGAEIKFSGRVQWVRGEEPKLLNSIDLLGDDGRGNMHFLAKGSVNEFESEGWVKFSAWVPTKIPLKRIRPGEALHEDMFVVQAVEVSTGLAHEYRGVLVSDKIEVAGLEAIQTILEGQFLTTVSVQKIPDLRRGDLVKIEMNSSGMVLSLPGVAEEPGYNLKKIRVMTSKSKRQLSGILHSGGVVEVQL